MTPEQEQYIIQHWNEMPCDHLRKMFNQEFGTLYKSTAFHYHTNRLGLSKHVAHKYTAEEDEFLRVNARDMSREELAAAFNKKYGTEVTAGAIMQRCHLKGWKSCDDGKFKNGSVPWEKTKGGRGEYVKKLKGGNSTSFMKGNIPENTYPVGTVTTRSRGVPMIKTDQGWKRCNRYLWEQAHGKIPEGYVVISVDGNKYEKDINKLRLISNQTLTVLMHNRWCGNGETIVDTGILWSDLREALINSGVME